MDLGAAVHTEVCIVGKPVLEVWDKDSSMLGLCFLGFLCGYFVVGWLGLGIFVI